MPCEPLFVCVRVPEFAAQALVRLRPTLAGSAVAVLEGEPPLEKTCAMTLQARRLGVRHGMSRTELESFPKLQALRRSSKEETHAALALVDMASHFTPRVQELPRDAALTLALDMTGTARLLGSPKVVGQKLFRSARELGFFVRVASSRNLHTAACLLRAPGETVVAVPPGMEGQALTPLPLGALPLSAELLGTLTAWGIRTLGELVALPAAELVARLGQEGHRLHRIASGVESHVLVPAEPVPVLEEHLAFDGPVDNLESLLFAIAPMLDQLIRRAGERALLLGSVTVQLHLERPADQVDRDLKKQPESESEIAGPVHVRTLKPALPVGDRALLLKLLQLDLQAHPALAAVEALTVSAEPGPRPGVQAGLFAPQSPEPMRLEVTLARLAALVGEDRVGCAVLTDTHAREAFQMKRFCVVEEGPGRAKPRREPVPRTGVGLRRLRPAPRVEVTLADGRPHRLRVFGAALPARLTVQRAFGPWRRSGEWWSGAVWSFEEWDVDAQSEDGTRLLALLSNDRLGQQWQMEALYD